MNQLLAYRRALAFQHKYPSSKFTVEWGGVVPEFRGGGYAVMVNGLIYTPITEEDKQLWKEART